MSSHQGDALHRLTSLFVDSELVPLMVVFALALGVAATLGLPSEEEPQIIVPMIDVHVSMPGASPPEIEQRVVGPMEKLLWEIPGVEYVYSTAMDGQALSIVRFEVGHATEDALIKTYAKLYQHLDWIPPGCSMPLLKPKSIDDVPVVAITFTSPGATALTLRHMALEVAEAVRRIPGVAEVAVLGGSRRGISVEPDPEKLRQLGLDLADVVAQLEAHNQAEVAGDIVSQGVRQGVRLWSGLACAEDVRRVVVAVRQGSPVYLEDVARVEDGPLEPEDYVFFAAGPRRQDKNIMLPSGILTPAVTLTVAKRPGESATRISHEMQQTVNSLKGVVIPHEVETVIVRDYGATARHKSDELLFHLALAAVSVGAIVAVFLGLRASLVVMIAVPVTLAITLATYWLLGYTLNRVTLFALIFCIGILVDDPIVDVENIVRHLRLPQSKGKTLSETIVDAVSEVRGPLVLATFTVIAAIMPMAFVRGLMGPYMRPMPLGASIAMLLSMAVAFCMTPWLAKRFLGREIHHHEPTPGRLTNLYIGFMRRLVERPWERRIFLAGVVALLLGAMAFFPLRLVLVKMLPFDNKSELEVVVDMPEGTALEETVAAMEGISRAVLADPAVTDIQIYAGTAAPFTFNGLVRHYYARAGAHEGEIQVNLAPRHLRSEESHAIALRLRQAVQPIAQSFGANAKVVEVPPGPPVLQTVVAEIYGPTPEGRQAIAQQVRDVFARTPNVVDVDWYVTDPHEELRVDLIPDKAVALGISPLRARQVVATALAGTTVGLVRDPKSREDVPITVRLPQRLRARQEQVAALGVQGAQGVISLGELATIRQAPAPAFIYHKNLFPVVYVTADMAGGEESPIYAMGRIGQALDEIAAAGQGAWQTVGAQPLPRLLTAMPKHDGEYVLKWDGEWQITYEVFRDMGLAFAAVLVLIALLVVGWFGSYTTPLAIMAPIPLSLIGIIPAHALTGAFFTATSMIGFIAGAGIVVRNSIILVDFIELRRSLGSPLAQAVVEAGALRFRPMVLTALSVVAGAFVILFDPIFQGLAISLMAGEVAATLFSRLVVPVLYYMDQYRHGA
jgi:multidrug efflux pump subunit AcrB